VFLREDLRYVIVRDTLLLVELCEYSFSEGILKQLHRTLRRGLVSGGVPVTF
jgi:hypothetical protein